MEGCTLSHRLTQDQRVSFANLPARRVGHPHLAPLQLSYSAVSSESFAFKYSKNFAVCTRPHLWRSLPPICRRFLVPSCLGGGLNRLSALVTVSPGRRCSNRTPFRVAGPDPLILSFTDSSPLEMKCIPKKRSSSLRLFAIKPYTGVFES